jgi:hypothetical protein
MRQSLQVQVDERDRVGLVGGFPTPDAIAGVVASHAKNSIRRYGGRPEFDEIPVDHFVGELVFRAGVLGPADCTR